MLTCDTCGQAIDDLEMAAVEWLMVDGKAERVRICHKGDRPGRGCFRWMEAAGPAQWCEPGTIAQPADSAQREKRAQLERARPGIVRELGIAAGAI